MVRLKLYYPLSSREDEIESQFHYGSIKTYKNQINKIKKQLSQFHYGSIKTFLLLQILQVSTSSQFHYGSIKT